MKKGVLISIITICFIVGGFLVIRVMTQAEDIALSDDFTSSFINEDVETDEGFHYFESGNGKFSMWFPNHFYLEDEAPFYVSKDHYALYNLFDRTSKEEGLNKSITVRYLTDVDKEQAQLRFENVLEDMGFEGYYEEEESKSKVILQGKSLVTMENKKTVISDPLENPANRYFAVIKSNQSDQMLELTYRIDCYEDSSCSIESSEEDVFFNTVIENIVFNE
ncbi:hypothetical protein JOC54_000232 [Alkalihalobacillus xiaoxiensis]|uniref:Uncharacterized protein n=1 Tax=Shouchella xiaoxiensis TaxID=766895 RepID=A0ABS2SPB1_9BACI|nr:hypothetical protein [Shouchella xiaoxiensis]MBM7837001.1 hypothetical protein [Shouchella xiaoxiensis]